ncbi:MAG: acyltransferase family protein [Comamonas sp.]
MASSLHRTNSFDILRISAALAVIVCHHYYISDRQGPPWMNVGMIGGVAVMTFFTISGYLVTGSWLREPRLLPFAAKRLLRLWPGMLAAVVLNILVFGLAFTSLPALDFLRHPQTLEYFRNLLLYRAYVNLPGVFEHNPLALLMNGPLWTIPMEAMCYAVLAAAGVLGLFRYRWLATLALLGYVLVFIARYNADFTGTMMHWYEYPAYFACGALLALHRDRFAPHALAITGGLIPIALFFWLTGLQHTAGLLVLPALLIFLGSQSSAFSGRLSRLGDPSYGIYLSGCPIAQAVYATWPGMNFYASMLLSCLLAVLLGYLLWHAIESPALRLKRHLPAPGRTLGPRPRRAAEAG